MENPAKLLCQNKGRDMNDKTMKALANDILAKCQEQELSYYKCNTCDKAMPETDWKKNFECAIFPRETIPQEERQERMIIDPWFFLAQWQDMKREWPEMPDDNPHKKSYGKYRTEMYQYKNAVRSWKEKHICCSIDWFRPCHLDARPHADGRTRPVRKRLRDRPGSADQGRRTLGGGEQRRGPAGNRPEHLRRRMEAHRG